MIYKTDTFVIDTDKITYMVDVQYGYWEIHFIGGSHVRVWNDLPKEITCLWKQESQKENER